MAPHGWTDTETGWSVVNLLARLSTQIVSLFDTVSSGQDGTSVEMMKRKPDEISAIESNNQKPIGISLSIPHRRH